MAVTLHLPIRPRRTPAKVAAANLTPVRQRTQFTCVAASTAMCLQALGVQNCDEDTVNHVLGAAPMKGASWEQVLATAQHYGVRATLTVPATLSQVKAWTDAGKPVMIGWNPEGREWSHASVIFDVQECPVHGFMVHVADPNCPDPEQTVRVVPKSEFYAKWYERFPNYLVRRPALMLDREVTPEGRQVMASLRSPVLVDEPAVVPVEAPMSKQAKSPAPVVQKKNPNVMRGEAPASRNPVVQGLIERGNAGAGKHKNKGDFDRGHARSPKHKGKGWGSEYMTLPVEEACGAEYMQDHSAKFEEGVSADPTKNMSEADAAEWKKQNAIHRSEFKTARAFDPSDWPKALEDYVLHNPLSLGDRWDIVKMSHDEFKVEAVESVMYLHAKTYYVGEAIVSIVGRTAQGKTFKKQVPLDNKTVPALIALLKRAKTAASDKRPGPFIEITGKDGLYKVTRYQPTEPGQTRATTMVAWGEVQRVTKAGAPTGKGFAAQFHTGNKVGVDWKGNGKYLSAPYKEVRALPAKTAAVAGLLPSEAAHLRSAGLEDACWEGYEAVGMKEQGGKQVPNCVPVKTAAHRLDGVRGHQLLPATVARKLPALYSQENVANPTAWVKLFSPYTGAVWYLTEYDPSSKEAFGWADLGMGGGELGYISIPELEGLNKRGLPLVERDLYWRPTGLSEAKRSRTASQHHAKFPRGEKMTVEEVAAVVGPEFKEMNENPPESVLAIRREMAKKAKRN